MHVPLFFLGYVWREQLCCFIHVSQKKVKAWKRPLDISSSSMVLLCRLFQSILKGTSFFACPQPLVMPISSRYVYVHIYLLAFFYERPLRSQHSVNNGGRKYWKVEMQGMHVLIFDAGAAQSTVWKRQKVFFILDLTFWQLHSFCWNFFLFFWSFHFMKFEWLENPYIFKLLLFYSREVALCIQFFCK